MGSYNNVVSSNLPHRPPIIGTQHIVSSGHYLASSAGYRILEQGGNAVDAGVASGIAINVVQFHQTNFGGVAPITLYDAATHKVVTISGVGRWPQAASVEYFEEHYGGDMPLGILRTVTPAAPDAWLTALEKFGTMTFEQVVTPALELAENGFPMSVVQANIRVWERPQFRDVMKDWDSTMKLLKRDGQPMEAGDIVVQKDLARTFRRLIDVERENASKGRESAIRAARDYFYKGDIADEIVKFCQEQGGLLTKEDMAAFSVEIEEAVTARYKDYEVFTGGPWCQGPVTAQTLQLLENDDLQALGHNTTDYIHLVSEALNLAFSDREYYYGDPDFVDVPMNGLMSKDYARARRGLIDPERAFGKLPPKGDPRSGIALLAGHNGEPIGTAEPGGEAMDTSYTCVVDRWGNAFSATPSDFVTMSPIVPGLGLVVSGRGISNWLERDHPACVAPGKRPRLTPNAAMAFKDGKLMMPFGTPGGDIQCQALVQTFLNMAEFGMNPQQAIDAPRFVSWNFPNSFWPHAYMPGKLVFDDGISSEVVSQLARRGHDTTPLDAYFGSGSVCAIVVDHDKGILQGAADYRRDAYAIGR